VFYQITKFLLVNLFSRVSSVSCHLRTSLRISVVYELYQNKVMKGESATLLTKSL
jgi:hypothetical protein